MEIIIIMNIHAPMLNAITCVTTLRKHHRQLLEEIGTSKKFSPLSLTVLAEECFTKALGNEVNLERRWQALKRKVSDLRDPIGLIVRCCLRNPNQDGFLELMRTPGLAKELLSGLAQIPRKQLSELCETYEGGSKVFCEELQQMINAHLPKGVLEVSWEIQKQMIFSCINKVNEQWVVEHPLARQFQGVCQETYDQIKQLSIQSVPAFNTLMRMIYGFHYKITPEVSAIFDKYAVFSLPDYARNAHMSTYQQHEIDSGFDFDPQHEIDSGFDFEFMQLQPHETILGLTAQIVASLQRLYSSSSEAFQEFMTAITNVHIQDMSEGMLQNVKAAGLSEVLSRDVLQASKILIILKYTMLDSEGKYYINNQDIYSKTI